MPQSPSLAERLPAVLAEALTIVEESDEALTVSHGGLVASLRVVTIAEGLELVALTAPLAWDLPLSAKTRARVAAHTADTLLGTVVLVEKAGGTKTADVLLRYNFPATGLSDEALRTLILLVLATAADVRVDLAP
jgi:hypothetical protein